MQAVIVAPGSPYEYPGDLTNKPVAVNFHTGSHYGAIHMLGGHLLREQITLVHMGGPRSRWDALVKGDIAATPMMEPWISFALKAGGKILAESRYRGSEVVTWDTTPDQVHAFGRALNRAVSDFNAQPGAYIHHILEDLPADLGRLEPHEFGAHRLRYLPLRAYPKTEFERTYQWLLRWDLIDGGLAYEDVVDPSCFMPESGSRE